ncbi:hypothetical protein KUL42_32760 [Alteromonas sp. KUL42]|uniref:helix-turn-helix domain-containing protein n=1 Tax=Alteromonas sp. KUL42 TaxID=2480797 RepID=UPI0010365F4F|nr:helix-turn-helix transcriptional regulator [Alteromonas sp. KUL42]TAP33293.1 XRE family transcriptional regulator [Alteromonas sp. KUL42]GEA08515.1 hypothetical protein KUL42_32760 [Alteromonas sp. KUL42]
MDTKTTIGNRIRIAREKAGLTVPQLAFRCDWSKSRISNYENGIRTAGIEEINKLSDALEPFLGKYVNFYFVEGTWPNELGSSYRIPALTIEKSVQAFREVIGDAIDFGRIKLEPGLNPSELVESYSRELVKLTDSNATDSSSSDAQKR